MRKAITLLLALVMTASLTYADFFPASNVPNLITYQGKLLTALGLPVTNNAQSITFRIMDADVAGNELWAETQTVNVVNGLYTVVLGSVVALPEDLATYAGLYLEVVIDGTPLAPRTRMHSVPYALMAKTIDQKGAFEGQYLQWSDGAIGDGILPGWYPAFFDNTLQTAYDGGRTITIPYMFGEGDGGYALPVTINYEMFEAGAPTVLDVYGNTSFTGDMTVTGTLNCDGDIGATNLYGNGANISDLDPYYLMQRGATNGQVLAWNTANTRWQPLTIATDLQSAYVNNNNIETGNQLTLSPANGNLEITGTANFIVSSPFQVTSEDPLYLPAAGKVLTSDADGFAHWQAISSVVGWNYDAVNDYLYTNMGRVGIGVNDPSAKLEVRYDDNSYNAVDIETSGDAYALRVASTGSTMNALDVIGNLSVAGYSILENATTDDIPALSVLTNNASAIYMQNNSFNYPALDVSNASPYQALAVTGTAAGVALVDLSNNGDGTTLKISNDNPDGSALEVYGAKSSFGAEVLHNVTGTETAVSIYSDAYALNVLTGNIKLSSEYINVGADVDLNTGDHSKFSSIILDGNPGSSFLVKLPPVTAEDAGRIVVITNMTGQGATVSHGADPISRAFDVPVGQTATFMCVGDDLWAIIGTGEIMPTLP